MRTIMLEIGEPEFKKLYSEHTEMYDKINAINKALLGDEYRSTGVIGQMKELDATFKAHDKDDKDNFKIIFDFQKKQTLYVGWTGIAVRLLISTLLVLGGWLIAILT